jgi:hypothetical protein
LQYGDFRAEVFVRSLSSASVYVMETEKGNLVQWQKRLLWLVKSFFTTSHLQVNVVIVIFKSLREACQAVCYVLQLIRVLLRR